MLQISERQLRLLYSTAAIFQYKHYPTSRSRPIPNPWHRYVYWYFLLSPIS